MFDTPSFKRLPFEMFDFRCHTAGIPVTVCDIPARSALNHLYLMDVVLGVGTPNNLGHLVGCYSRFDYLCVCTGCSHLGRA